jgi:hypothetical protein
MVFLSPHGVPAPAAGQRVDKVIRSARKNNLPEKKTKSTFPGSIQSSDIKNW